jgi:hypothetical protein
MTEALPLWAACVADRLVFLAQRCPDRMAARELAAALAALRRHVASPQNRDRALQNFLHACLDEFAAAVESRPDLADIRGELDTLCGLARTALDADCDDRPLLARTQAMTDLTDAAHWAAVCVPGRVVFLGAMAAQMPDEECPAATMLVNDLAAVDFGLPLRALQAVVRPAPQR